MQTRGRVSGWLGSLFRDGISLATSDFLWKVALLSWVIVVGRTCGEESLGGAELALTLGALIHLISNLGLSTHLPKTIPGSPSSLPEIASTAATAKLLSSLLLHGALLTFLILRGESAGVLIQLLGGYLFFSLAEFGFYFQRALVRFGDEARARAISALVLLTLVGIGGVLRVSVPLFATFFLIGTALYLGLSLRAATRLPGRIRFSFGKKTVALVRKSITFGLSDVLGLLFLKVDVFLIAALAGAAQLGIYSVPSRIILGFLFIPAMLTAALLPRAGSQYAANPGHALRGIRNATLGLLLVSVAIAAGTFLVSDRLLHLLLGDRFQDSAAILRLLALYLVVRFLNFPLSTLLVVTDRQRLRLLLTGAALGANVALNLVLIPWLGAMGAALATLLSEVALAAAFFSATRTISDGARPEMNRLAAVASVTAIGLALLLLSPFWSLVSIASTIGSVVLGLFLLARTRTAVAGKTRTLVLRYSPGNRGDDFILESLLAHLRPILPPDSLEIVSRRPEELERLPEPTHEFKGADLVGLLKLGRLLVSTRVLLLAGGTNLRECEKTKETFSPLAALGSLPTTFAIISMARILNVEIGFVSQGFKPPRRRTARVLLRFCLRRIGFLSARDLASHRIAGEVSGRGALLGADLGFTHPEAGKRRNPPKRLGIGVSFRPATAPGSVGEYTRRFAKELRDLADRTNPIELLSFSSQPDNPLENDDGARRELIALVSGEDERVSNAPVPETSDELLQTLAGYELVVATRLHACILSLLSGTPVVGIGYDEKVTSLFEELGLPELCIAPAAILDRPGVLTEAVLRLRESVESGEWTRRAAPGLSRLRSRSRAEIEQLTTWIRSVYPKGVVAEPRIETREHGKETRDADLTEDLSAPEPHHATEA